MLAFRAGDGANQPGGYADTCVPSCCVPVNTPDQVNDVFHWQPLRVPDGNGGFVVQKYLTPHWGNVTPFALTSPNQFLPPGPERLTLGLLDEEVNEMILQSAALTDLQKVRVEYWAEGPTSETPPGHWCLFAQAISRARGHRLDQDANPTPPFPEYVSGHSTFSSAGARVLLRFTGADTFGARVTFRAGASRIEPGATPLLAQILTWPTFSAALDEAGRSRRQGGIHFHDGDFNGRALGTSVGQNAWTRAQTYFNGTAG